MTLSRLKSAWLVCSLLAVPGLGACNKDAPAPAPVTTAAAPSVAAPDAAVAEAPVAKAEVPDASKSDELRFIESTAEMLCAERNKKKQLSPRERSALLARHGFAGKQGEERYTGLSMRGDRDREWGKATTQRIQAEMVTLCPKDK